jgi:hypothetical protein
MARLTNTRQKSIGLNIKRRVQSMYPTIRTRTTIKGAKGIAIPAMLKIEADFSNVSSIAPGQPGSHVVAEKTNFKKI